MNKGLQVRPGWGSNLYCYFGLDVPLLRWSATTMAVAVVDDRTVRHPHPKRQWQLPMATCAAVAFSYDDGGSVPGADLRAVINAVQPPQLWELTGFPFDGPVL